MSQSEKNGGTQAKAEPLRFGNFELDQRTGELRRAGVLIHLQPQPMKLLALLAARPGELVTREEIQKELWSGETFVDFERSINICVMQIRAALGDDAESPRFIETLPRRGYRFLAWRAPAGAGEASAAVTAPLRAQQPSRKWLVPTLAGCAVVILLGIYWTQARVPVVHAPAASPRVMLAVLPFENLSGREELAYVSDGMTEELIAQLGRVAPERLGVIARTSAMRFQGVKDSVAKIGKELGVQYIVEGSVRLEKERAWFTGQLIRVSDQTHLWSDTYEMAGASLFTLQELAAGQIAANVTAKLLPGGEFASGGFRSGSSNPAAMDAYLQGRYLSHKGGRDDITRAVEQLEKATALDPAFAGAQAALADTLQFAAMLGTVPVREAYPRARRAADVAAGTDPQSSETQAALGLVALWFEWDAPRAAIHFEKAIAANASNAEAHHDYAWTLVALGRDEEAVREIQAAQALDPVSPRANMDIGWIYLGVRRWDDAIRHCTRMVEVEPRAFFPAQSCLETAYLAKGDTQAAAAAAILPLERMPGSAERAALLKRLPPLEALRAIWKSRLEERMGGATVRKAYRASGLHLQLGDKQSALRHLERALEEREMLLVMLHRTPDFDPLRDEPRFQRILSQIRTPAVPASPQKPDR